MRVILAIVLTTLLGSVHAPVHINNQSSAQPEMVETVQQVTEPTVAEIPTETTAVVETPAPVIEQVQEISTCESEIAKYDWNQSVALAVMYAESGGNTYALNDNYLTADYSVGCFQINLYGSNALYRPSEYELYDPAINVAYAYKLYTGNGRSFIGQWGVCRSKVACY